MLIVLGADVVLRCALGGQVGGVEVPTGVVTSLVGAVFVVLLAAGTATRARRGPPRGATRARGSAVRGARPWRSLRCSSPPSPAAMLGDTVLLTGDVLNWATGRSGPTSRTCSTPGCRGCSPPSLAGAALAVAGAVVQAVCRNPLAEPGILGVTGGAGLGAVW